MTTTRGITDLRRSSWKGLLWMDFQRHRPGLLLGLPTIAFAVLILGLVEDAGGPMFFWLGLAMAVGAGTGFGSGEWSEGVEEYSLGLPPTRRDRYFVRLALGLAFLLVVVLLGLAAGPFGWVRSLWALTPLPLPARAGGPAPWAGLNGPGFYLGSAGLSLAVFCECFAVSINAERRGDTRWVTRVIPFGLAAFAVLVADRQVFGDGLGYLTGLLGAAYAVPRSALGARRFERKDVVLDGPAPGLAGASRPRALALVVLIGLTVLLTVGAWLYLSRR